MKAYLDCYPCFLRQAIEAVRLAGVSEGKQQEVIAHVLAFLAGAPPLGTPPEIAGLVHRIVRQDTDNCDPYQAVKGSCTREALALYPRLKALIAEASDPLEVAIRLSIAGNIIDFGLSQQYDLWKTVERVLVQPLAVNNMVAFREALAGAGQILYLADNAGETVFDRVLIEMIGVPVIYAVKGGSVLNDATLEDALAAGLDQAAKIMSTGSDVQGTVLTLCSAGFRSLFNEARLIIAKGQANYETLSELGKREHVFYFLQTKCPVIARDVGVPVDSIVVGQGLEG